MTSNFQNVLWNYDLQTDVTQIYQSKFDNIQVELAIYTNTQYDSYATYLSGVTAAALVDEDVDYLTQSVLNSFQSKINNEYDSWSLHMQLSYDTLTTTNQEAALCMEERIINNGIWCVGVSTGNSALEVTETFVYWLPPSVGDSLYGSYDLTQSANDQYLISDYYGGMTHFKVTVISDNAFQADKFLPYSLNNNEQWTFELQDFRYL